MKTLKIVILVFLSCVFSTPWVLAGNFFMLDDELVADQTSYTAGSEITYHFERTVSCPDNNPYFCEVDHCQFGWVFLDPRIDIIDIGGFNDYFYYCTIYGDTVFCEDSGQSLAMFGPYNRLVIRGKIKADTPEGTILTSTSLIGPCVFWGSGEGWASSESESKVIVTGTPVPEFPSTFLAAIMIFGFLGAMLLIQKTREY